MNPCEHALALRDLDFSMACTRKDARCGYHKQGQCFVFSDITPGGLCPEAYHNIYYISLGLLFNAKFPEKDMLVKCPGEKNFVVFKAGFEKLNQRMRFLNLVKRCLYRFYPGQVYQGHLAWKVSDVKGTCLFGHEINNKFVINSGNFQITKNILFPLGEPHSTCPAMFDQLFPLLFAWKKEMRLPYSREVPDMIHCPDHMANITFAFSKFSKF